MEIAEFVKDRQRTIGWLVDQSAKLERLGYYFSYWSHNDGLGFGLVVTADHNSGELHLMANGSVSYYVEVSDPIAGNMTVLEDVSREAASFNDFEYTYGRFKDLVLGLIPDNSFKPNPHQVR